MSRTGISFETCKISALYPPAHLSLEMNRKLAQATVIMLATVLVLPLLLSGVARADDGGNRDTNVNVSGQGGYFSVDSQSTNTVGPKNDFNMVFTGNAFIMQFKNNSQQAGFSLQFNIQLERLVVINGSGNTSVLLNFSQQEFELSSPSATVNGVKTFSLSTENDNASFEMTIQVSGTRTNMMSGNTTAVLTPNEVKLSFVIRLVGSSESGGYRYQQGVIPKNVVALELGVQSASSSISPIQNEGTYSQIAFTQGKSSGYFSWANNATVNGTVRNIASQLSSNNTLTIEYPAGMVIVHDPYLGISSSTIISALTSAPGNIVIYAVTLAVSVALIGGAMTARRRRT